MIVMDYNPQNKLNTQEPILLQRTEQIKYSSYNEIPINTLIPLIHVETCINDENRRSLFE